MSRLLTTFRKNQTKTLLRDYFNTKENKTFTSVINIKKYFGFDNTAETYQYLLDNYNREVIIKRKNIKSFDSKINRKFKNLFNDKSTEISLSIDNAFQNGYDSIKQVVKTIINNYGKVFNDGMVVMTIGNINYMLNNRSLERLERYINNNLVELEDTTESDERVILNIQNNDLLTFKKFVVVNKNKKKSGGFFKYFNNTEIDLSRYGVYSKRQWNEKNWSEGDECLIHSLQIGGISEEKVSYLKTLIKDLNIPLCQLDSICEKLKIRIELKRVECNKQEKDRFIYGKKYEETYKIGFYDEHYFLNESVDYTSYSIKNYESVKDIKNFNKLIMINKYSNIRFITSYELIKILVEEQTCLEKISFSNSQIVKTQYYKKVEQIFNNLNYTEKNYKSVNPKEDEDKTDKTDKKNKIIYNNVYFDFETHTDNINKQHIPYMCCCIDSQDNKRTFIGEDCGLQMLKSLKSHTQLIAHNASYDYRFIVQHLYKVSPLMRGSRLLSASGVFYKCKIKVKCSYHLISMPLSDFPKTFGLTSEKEVMPYSLYNTNNNVNKRFIPLEECLNHLKTQVEKDRFFENVKKWNCFKDSKVDIIEYSKKYCEMDCEVLKKGYNVFKKWIDNLIQLNIDEIITTASLAHRYFINEGCYNEVKQLSGVPQMFIQKCVVGGRTMCKSNEKMMKTGKVNDFDAVSLYPSAMNRIEGFLKGVPKVIIDLSYDNIKNKNGYFLEIVIKSVGKKRDFPLMSYINDNSVRIFSNEMIGKTIFIDKIALEDLIKFQEVDFDIVRGYYFDSGFNPKIKDTIKFLFDERCKLKKQGNKAEMIYKLLMNSGYGRSIMKPIEDEIKIFDDTHKLNVFISRNYNWVKEYTQMGDKTIVKVVKSLDEHYNIAHVGVSILSMSKRIMNEVMCLAEDNNIEMFYQDTDSIHLYDKDINKLSSSYQALYNRELIGKGMGQFHSDFDGEIYCEENGNIIADKKLGKKFYKKIEMEDVYAINSIFLGKKCYIDELECVAKDGNKYIDYHIRMKGIPNSCILYTTKLLGYNNPIELYKDLYKGKSIGFDLTEGGNKDNFELKKDYTITTKEKFSRIICFK